MALSADELQSIAQNPYKQDFTLLANRPGLSFLDSAATSQRPAAVIEAQKRFYETMNANPLRGLYGLSVAATQAIDCARGKVASFIGAYDKDGTPQNNQIIFTRNTSESLNLVAHSLGGSVLGPGDEVVITIMEHHSNLIPWQQVCRHTGAKLIYMYLNEDFFLTDDEIASKIGPAAKIVSVTQVSNVLGVEVPVARVAARAHEMGAYLVVDGAQSAPHVHVDVRELGCDLFACSAHKMGGPMGIGILWGRKDLLNAMPPFLTGGEMIDSVTQTDAVWARIPQKFEAGTQDAAGAYAFGVAVDYLNSKGFDALEARERLLVRYLTDELESLDFIDIVGPTNGSRHVGAVAFNVRGVHPHDVASILDMQEVCIRAGHHCAQPLLANMGLNTACRASVGFYNDKGDIDKLIDALKTVWQVFHAND